MEPLHTITKIIKVGRMCYESYPCKHGLETDKGSYFCSGPEIARLQMKLNGTVDVHFVGYMDSRFDKFASSLVSPKSLEN